MLIFTTDIYIYYKGFNYANRFEEGSKYIFKSHIPEITFVDIEGHSRCVSVQTNRGKDNVFLFAQKEINLLLKMGLCVHTLVKIICVKIISCQFNRKISNKVILELFLK